VLTLGRLKLDVSPFKQIVKNIHSKYREKLIVRVLKAKLAITFFEFAFSGWRPANPFAPIVSNACRLKRRVAHLYVTGTGTEACTPEPDPCTRSISAPTARNFSTIPSYPRSM